MRHKPGAIYLLIGSLLYLVGTVLVTIVFNVLRNDALAAVEPASADVPKNWLCKFTILDILLPALDTA